MKQNAIREFNVWLVCLMVGVSVLATELVVKARRPSAELIIPVATEIYAESFADDLAGNNVLPEEVVASLLVDSVIQIESGGRAGIVGGKGERGLMQIKEGTWRDTTRRIFGRPVSFDQAFRPDVNRTVGTAYLAHLHQFILANRDQWQADERSLLLACYNAGPQRVAKAGFDLNRLPSSTRDYVQRASALHNVYLNHHAIKLAPGPTRGGMQIVQVLPAQGS